MKRYYIIKDGTLIGAAPTREDAIDMIEQKKKRDPQHFLLKPEYWIIYGEEQFI